MPYKLPLKERVRELCAKLRPADGGKPHNLARFFRWSYKKLSSIYTSVYLLSLLAFLYVIGTIFPQGGDMKEYVEAGGKFVFFVKVFDLLDFFFSPLFLLIAFVLFLNLSVCTYERYLALFAQRVLPKTFEPTHGFSLTQNTTEAFIDVRKVLRELGFRVASKDQEWILMEKGLPWRWLTWLYHAGIALCFIGFLLTYLLAYEDRITLKHGEPQTVSPSITGRFQSIWKDKAGSTDYNLFLEEFSTDYAQSPTLKYPKEKLSRLAVGLGWDDVEYEITDESFFPLDWKSKIKVMKNGLTLTEKTMEVNDPLDYGGYTFYQEDFEQVIKIRVDNNPILLEAKTGEEFMVPGVDTPLKFGILRAGTLHKLDGTTEKINPFALVRRSVKEARPRPEDGVKFEIGETIYIDGVRLTFMDYEENSILSYRYDPGVPILWFGGIFVLALMALRFYGGWYHVAYNIAEKDGIVILYLNIASKGLSANTARLVKRIEHSLTLNDIRPVVLPPEV